MNKPIKHLSWLVGYLLAAVMVCALMLWTLLFWWVHQPFLMATWLLMMWLLCGGLVVLFMLWQQAIWRLWQKPHLILGSFWRYLCLGFWVASIGSLLVFFMMPARNDRTWNPEVAKQATFDRQDNIITVHNVRNFDWHSETDYTEQWQSRQYDLDKLTSMDLILSIWDNPNIAHTMISFGFKDGQRLVFSVEIRKEVGESFSSIGGFFRLYELALIAADEKDVIYTRSNIRQESVYIYPISYDKAKMQQLFLIYLNEGKELQNKPQWYNTLLSNCTTVIYQMVKDIDNVPMDYRILASGRLPAYLYELGALDNRHSLMQLQQVAYINPKVAQYSHTNPISSTEYSQAIRQGLDGQ